MRAPECGEKSAESENDPETRDSEALIKRGDGLCSAPGDNVMRHASCPVRISLSLLNRNKRTQEHARLPDTHIFTFSMSHKCGIIRQALFLEQS